MIAGVGSKCVTMTSARAAASETTEGTARVVGRPQRRASEADAGDVDGVAFEEVDTVLTGRRMRRDKLFFARSPIAPPFVIARHEDGRLARGKRAHHADRFFQRI
jgi:hypothetical protein